MQQAEVDRMVFTGPGGQVVVQTLDSPRIIHLFGRGQIDSGLLSASAQFVESRTSIGVHGALCDLSATDTAVAPAEIARVIAPTFAAGYPIAVVVSPRHSVLEFFQGLRAELGDGHFRTFNDIRAALAWLGSLLGNRQPAPAGGEAGHAASIPGGQPQPSLVRVNVKGSGIGELLDFQERISGIEGVARVSIHAIDAERATLLVELQATEPPLDP